MFVKAMVENMTQLMQIKVFSLSMIFAVWAAGTAAQEKSADDIWTKIAPEAQRGFEASKERTARSPTARVSTLFELNNPALLKQLEQAPPEDAGGNNAAPERGQSRVDVIISVPQPDGTFQRFSVESTELLAPELAAKFPEIKSYRGTSVDGDAATLSIQVTPQGFFGQIRTESETIVINPVSVPQRPAVHESFTKSDAQRRGETRSRRQCLTRGATQALERGRFRRSNEPMRFGGALRTYRMAVGATGEYTQQFGGTISGAMSAIAVSIGRISQVYREELSIRFQLVANNDKVVFLDPETDPFTNDSSGELIEESQGTIDREIGDANYDIGHTFATSDGGLAPGLVGVTGQKARGMTGQSNPIGDPFDIDYVAHEVGHQFNGNHTFNAPSCSNGGRWPDTAYEPGSGSTIMGYTGICGATDNIQKNSHPYFLFASLEEIAGYVASADNQPPAVPAGNSPPQIRVKNLPSSETFSVPKRTPFRLDAEGSDSNGDAVFYTWEQEDLGVPLPLGATDDGKSPLFRSVLPGKNSSRDFPRLQDTLSGAASPGERLPDKERTITLRVTARDKKATGGGFAGARARVKVVAAAGPFKITAPAAGAKLGNSFKVTWHVAKTDKAPIATKFVNILLSSDGGASFPAALLRNTANDGSETVTIPSGVKGPNMRIRIEAAESVYYAISPGTFTIKP